jgi:hypothetical protein
MQELIRESFESSLVEGTGLKVKELKENAHYGLVNWREVGKDCGVSQSSINTSKFIVTDEEIVFETRRRFFSILKRLYWHQFEHGQCFRRSVFTLTESANRSLDKYRPKIKDWKYILPSLLPKVPLMLLNCFSRCRLFRKICRKWTYVYIIKAYDTAKNYLEIHKKAEELLKEAKIVDNMDIFEETMRESHAEMEKAKQFLLELLDVYPEVGVYVQTYQTRSLLLYKELHKVEEAYSEGTITRLEYTELKEFVQKKIEKHKSESYPSPPTLSQSLQTCPLFQHLSPSALASLLPSISEESLAPNQWLAVPTTSLCVLLKGRVLEQSGGHERERRAGEVIGIQFLIPEMPFRGEEIAVKAVVKGELVRISMQVIEDLVEHDAVFSHEIHLLYAKYVLELRPEMFGELRTFSQKLQHSLFSTCTLQRLQQGQLFYTGVCGLLLKGTLSNGILAPAYLDGKEESHARADSPCVLLVFANKPMLIHEASDRKSKSKVRLSIKLRAKSAVNQVDEGARKHEGSFAASESDSPLLASINSSS